MVRHILLVMFIESFLVGLTDGSFMFLIIFLVKPLFLFKQFSMTINIVGDVSQKILFG